MEEQAMNWIYDQRSGRMTGPTGVELTGYSGSPTHRNNPASEAIRNNGPIPRGTYAIDSDISDRRGPVTIRLTPVGHSAHGRSGFLIHGENARTLGASSQGCIILNRQARDAIHASGSTTLIVR